MKIIFETLKKSIYNPTFYKSIAEEPLSKGVRYYIKISLIVAVFVTTMFGIYIVPQAAVFLKDGAPEIIKNYFPSELTVDIKKGEAGVNVEEPYIIPGKDAIQQFLKEQGLTSMLVIDTKHDFDKSKFEEYKTFALLTKTEIATQGSNGQIVVSQLKDAPDVVVNQELLLSIAESAKASRWYIIIGGVAVAFVVILLGYLLYLVALLFFALVPFIVSYINKSPLSYKNAYKISVYAIVPAIVLKMLISLLGFGFIPIHFTFLVFMLVIAVNMRDDGGKKQAELTNN